MKTTENISLAGYAFVIETDAYYVLSDYIDAIHESLKQDSSADEIVRDIEERIGEILNEKCKGGIVNSSMVEYVKQRIGDPSELVGDSDTSDMDPKTEEKKEKHWWKNKRLYRNIDERIIAGVCAGLSNYFGIDKVIIRLIFILLLFIAFAGAEEFFSIAFVVYIALWIATPAARTVEQKCKLKGEPLNIGDFKAKENNIKQEINEVSSSPAVKSAKKAGSVIFGIMFLALGLLGLIACLFIPAAHQIIIDELHHNLNNLSMHYSEYQMLMAILDNNTFWILLILSCSLFFIWFIYNGVIMTFNLNSPDWKPGMVIFLLWIISIIVVIAVSVFEISKILPDVINLLHYN